MFKKELYHINDRLTFLGFHEYREGKLFMPKYILSTYNDTYIINLRYININNLRCELIKRETIGGVIFTGGVMTSCVISDWQNNRMDVIDNWIENFLLIPELIFIVRKMKINKIIKTQ